MMWYTIRIVEKTGILEVVMIKIATVGVLTKYAVISFSSLQTWN